MFRFLCLLLITVAAFGQRVPAPERLRCELLLHTDAVSQRGERANVPLARAVQQAEQYQFARIYNMRPMLSWELAPSVRRQTAFRVRVARSADGLQKNIADVWDSGRRAVSQPLTRFAGKALAPGQVYYWDVQVWNEQNKPSAVSAPMAFYVSPTDPAEPFAHYPLVAETQTATLVRQTGADSWFLDFGKDALCQLQLHLTSDVSDSIRIEVGELTAKPFTIHTNPGRNIRFRHLSLWVEKGTHDYTITWPQDQKRNSRNPVLMPDYIGEVYPFRYVALSNLKGKIDRSSVKRRVVSYPFDTQAARFTSGDTVLNQVWDLCQYSIKATSFAGYYVDGDRERIPYEADALINQLSHYAVDAEYSMARRSMNYLIYHPTWPTEWSLQNVPIAWNDYLYTGDTTLLSTFYTELTRKVLMPLAGPSGLISTRTGKQTDDFLASIHITKTFDGRRGLHDNVDWPQTGNYIGPEKEYKGETDGFVYNTYNAVINAWYYRNLVLMQQIARVLGKPDDARRYEQSATKVYDAFRTTFRDQATRLIKDGDSTAHTSLHANMFALAFGLVPPEDIPAVAAFMKSRKMACSVYGAQFLLDALYDAGLSDYALSLMTATTQRSWYNMIRVGSTITMEAWDQVYKPNLDLNHAWGAAPANIIMRKLVGVEPLTPGFGAIQIKPQPGDLSFFEATVPSPKGPVQVSYKKAERNTLTVAIPGGTTATVYVPYDPAKPKLTMDGKPLPVKPTGNFYVLTNVGTGRHELSVSR